ncbi:hypothetical protein H4CHR_01869 [Variovorax sp. PBS-H4]|uniref:hypothetical protein n=1 Tax=Variovorax sp. PBS-H4 TaxID=434008 RepID=UPI0013169497|nr:hypothetical protein [Variovorax sp. PBS-H4]VTU26810.1 hypothetical protein H4CHR_01869 [Variovorax sp. PBS-H4]
MATHLLRCAVVAALTLMAASHGRAPAQPMAPDRRHLASASVETLQRAYLDCDYIATRTLLDLASAAHCSLVGEELKQRAFGGDFDQLVAWWRANKRVHAEAVSESQMPDHGPGSP